MQTIFTADTLQLFRSKIRAYLLKLTADDDLADDLVQDVMLRMHEQIGQLRDTEKLSSWLYTIAYNAFVDHTRRNTSRAELIEPLADEPIDSVQFAGTFPVADCIRDLINQLPASQREAFEAVEINGLSQIDVAKQSGVPYSTVKSRYQKARDSIKALIVNNCFLQTDRFGNVIDYRLPGS